MEFDEKTHKVKWQKLTKNEAGLYISFLCDEIKRHQKARADAEFKASLFGGRLFTQLYLSAARRHDDDINETQVLIQSVKHWFELPLEE